MEKAAFFDFDGTLIEQTSELLLFRKLLRDRKIPVLLTAKDYLLLFLRRGFSRRTFRSFKPYLAGIPKEDLLWYGKALFPTYRLKTKIIHHLRSLQSRGYRIVLVTGSFDFLVAPFMQAYGISDAITYPLRATFASREKSFAAPIPHGAAKADLIRSFCEINQVDLPSSYAYGNSRHDLPMLRVIGNGFMVTKRNYLKRI